MYCASQEKDRNPDPLAATLAGPFFFDRPLTNQSRAALCMRCRDNFLILQALMAAAALYAFPSLRHLPLWDARGFAVALLAHVAATEPLFYAAHRALHASGSLYARYHSLHHSSKVPQPFTGTCLLSHRTTRRS